MSTSVNRENDDELAIYAELVDRLFANAVSIGSMACIFAIFGSIVAYRTQNPVVAVSVVAGCLASALHLAIVLAYRRRPRPQMRRDWRRWELRYGWAGLASGAFVGLTAAGVFLGDDRGSGMVVTGLIFGYAAGTMTRSATRPWMTTPRILALVATPIIALESRLDLLSGAQGLMLAFFTLAGLETMWSTHRQAVAGIELRLEQSAIARRDPLTGIGNRLALDEFLGRHMAQSGADDLRLAVHYLDLDHFKAVNDSYGHAVGDALLQAVAERLDVLTRPGDLATRLGGDEFVLVQTGLHDARQAESTAADIRRILGQPYRLGAIDLVSSATVGTAIARGQSTDALLREADAALYVSKSRHRDGRAPRGGAPFETREEDRLDLAS